MRPWAISLMVVTFLITSGCANNPRVRREIDQMGSQRRALEDQIYDLQYEYDKKVDEVARLKQQVILLEPQLDQRSEKDQEIESESNIGPALIDLSSGEVPKRIAPNIREVSGHPLANKESISPVNYIASVKQPSQVATPVESIEMNQLRTVMREADGNRLIDTVVLHITPRNTEGEFVAVADDVDVVIREKDATGRLLGQWKVAESELQRILARSIYRTTIPIELNLVQELDPSVELFLDVRFGVRRVRTSGVLSSRGISTSRSNWPPYR